MSTPFLGEIRLMAFDFPPKNWAFCQGQTLTLQQNQALYALIQQTFGGSGNDFMLPDLRGRVPLGTAKGANPGLAGGEENHTLQVSEIPSHNHSLSAQAAAGGANNVTPRPNDSLAESVALPPNSSPILINNFGTGSASITFASDTVGNNAGGQGHENRQPFLVLNYCIALAGIYPPRP